MGTRSAQAGPGNGSRWEPWLTDAVGRTPHPGQPLGAAAPLVLVFPPLEVNPARAGRTLPARLLAGGLLRAQPRREGAVARQHLRLRLGALALLPRHREGRARTRLRQTQPRGGGRQVAAAAGARAGPGRSRRVENGDLRRDAGPGAAPHRSEASATGGTPARRAPALANQRPPRQRERPMAAERGKRREGSGRHRGARGGRGRG